MCQVGLFNFSEIFFFLMCYMINFDPFLDLYGWCGLLQCVLFHQQQQFCQYFNDLLKEKAFAFWLYKFLWSCCYCLNTCNTHQAVAPCLMNMAAWCQSWPSRQQLSAKIQQTHQLCAWSRSQGEQQQQPCPSPVCFFPSISGQGCLVFACGEWTDWWVQEEGL